MIQRKKPTRMFRSRSKPDESMPELTPELGAYLEEFRKARETINPFHIYRLQMPDGTIIEAAGADLIATAEALVSVFDSTERGDDPRVTLAAFERLFDTY